MVPEEFMGQERIIKIKEQGFACWHFKGEGSAISLGIPTIRLTRLRCKADAMSCLASRHSARGVSGMSNGLA